MDHKNLTFDKLTSQRVLRWRCFCDEYYLTIRHIAGKENVLADNLSRLPRQDLDLATEGPEAPGDPLNEANWDKISYDCHHNLAKDLDAFIWDSFDCYPNLPEAAPDESPLNYEWICAQQQANAALLAKHQRHPQRYVYKTFDDDVELLCHVKPGHNPETQWKFAMATKYA